MPATYRIDRARGRIFTTLEGVITDQELIVFQQKLFADSDFEPTYSQLADCDGVTRFDVSVQTIRAVAIPNLFAKGSRLAIVAKLDVVYGMARMFQLLREGIAEEVRVFRDLDEANRWLES
jgi:hypothetical protein